MRIVARHYVQKEKDNIIECDLVEVRCNGEDLTIYVDDDGFLRISGEHQLRIYPIVSNVVKVLSSRTIKL